MCFSRIEGEQGRFLGGGLMESFESKTLLEIYEIGTAMGEQHHSKTPESAPTPEETSLSRSPYIKDRSPDVS